MNTHWQKTTAESEFGPDGIETFKVPHCPFAFATGKLNRKFLIQLELPESDDICICPDCVRGYDAILTVWILTTVEQSLSRSDPYFAVRVTPEP
jgi:hypothetical protein